MSAERRKGVYMISAVAELFDIHPQTLRLYEREGLLRPSRTEGNTRLYTDEDLKQLRTILNLRELGVNLAGVDIILDMRRKMERMQEEIAAFTRFIHRELERESDTLSERTRNALVRLPRRDMVPAGAPAAGVAGPGPLPEGNGDGAGDRSGAGSSAGSPGGSSTGGETGAGRRSEGPPPGSGGVRDGD